MEDTINFDLYRYQLLPSTRDIQLAIDSKIFDYDSLVDNKNKLLADVLKNSSLRFNRRDADEVVKLNTPDQDYFFLRLTYSRKDKLEKADFTEEEITRYPSIFVIFDNRPDRQLLFVQQNYKINAKTASVANFLERNLNRYLRRVQLNIYIKPIYAAEDFWKIIDEYETKVDRVIFEFIRPNMANISKALAEELKELQRDSNAHKSKLTLESPKREALDIDPTSQEIAGLVDYSAEGGGDITVKIKGIRQALHTNKSQKSVEIDSMEIRASNSNAIAVALRSIGMDP